MKGLRQYRKTHEQFVLDARKVHGDRYSYIDGSYTTAHTKISIMCAEHGEFCQQPTMHLQGGGCPTCSGRRVGQRSHEQFVLDARKVHGDRYSYIDGSYVKSQNKVPIICGEHGEFWQRPCDHFRGYGCPICGRLKTTRRDTLDEFIAKARAAHGQRYDYSKVEYINTKTKVSIVCPKHGVFRQPPNRHVIQKNGCPKCKGSVGEERVAKILQRYNVQYQRQITDLTECRNVRVLSFDFGIVIEDRLGLIEYNGKQHYISPPGWRSEQKFNEAKKRDQIKVDFCNINNIPLLVIPYWECQNLETLLLDFFNLMRH